MGLMQRQWARKQRLLLRRKLGMRCAHCGSRDCRKLEFDVIVPVNEAPDHKRREWSWRMSFYRAQDAAGNLQLLCGGSVGSCHNKKTSKENYAQPNTNTRDPY
jgi:5-methylcytosine-specific restriction endonuclease McrA